MLTVKIDLPVNHVAVVDFSQFEDDHKLGGIDITVARPIVSKFDCPYDEAVRPLALRRFREPAWTATRR